MGWIEYDSNNSGGSWWLTDDDWYKLEAAGWEIEWVKDRPAGLFHEEGEERFLGALAVKAIRRGLSRKMAIAEWEDVLQMDAYEGGCECCGQPHNFYEYDDEGNWVW